MICSLIILNYNDAGTTLKLLNDVQDYSTIDHIIVVDNCSTDDSYEQLKKINKKQKKIDVIKTEKNRGYAYGNNYGCTYALNTYATDYLVIANPDISFEENTLKKILTVFTKKEDIGGVSCLMDCKSDIDLPSAWKFPRYIDCILENCLILRRLIGNKTLYSKHDFYTKSIMNVDVIAGSFFVLSSVTFKAIDGFDENTFLYYEESILAYRMKLIGAKNYLITDEVYTHYHSVSINKNINSVKKRLDIAFDSRKYYCQRYLHCSKLQLFFLDVTYKLGLFDYLLAIKITGKKR